MGVARRRRFRPVLKHGFASIQDLILLCIVMLVYEHPVLFIMLTGGPSNGPDNPAMTTLFHPVLKQRG
jgi:hypothetical protein